MNSFSQDDKNNFFEASGLYQGAHYTNYQFNNMLNERRQGLRYSPLFGHFSQESCLSQDKIPAFGQVELLEDNCINFTFRGSFELFNDLTQEKYGFDPSIKWDSQISDKCCLMIGTFRNREPITESQGNKELINEMKSLKCSKMTLTVHLPVNPKTFEHEIDEDGNVTNLNFRIILGTQEAWLTSDLLLAYEKLKCQNLRMKEVLSNSKPKKRTKLRDVLKKSLASKVNDDVKPKEEAKSTSTTNVKKRKGKNQGNESTFKRKSKRPGRV